MFDNIGSKIKSFAKGVFIIETIAGIISGISIGISTEWDAAFWAILIIVASPFVAWVSAFLIYGFGQLIENSDKLVDNSNKLIKAYNEYKNCENNQATITPSSDSNTSKPIINAVHKWRCEKCGNMVSGKVCAICNPAPVSSNEHKWRCDKCGNMVSGESCPYCK